MRVRLPLLPDRRDRRERHRRRPRRRWASKPLDRYTVRFTLKRSFADFPETLGSIADWVWPVDYLRRVGRERFGQQPSGTGPFMVDRLVRGEYADLVRNPDWWDAASGRPYLDAVHFRVFPSVSAELQAFQKGLVDYTWVPQGQVAASRSLPEVRSGEWTAQTVPLLCMGYFCFRVTDPIMRGEKGLLLRRAINYACDRKKMIAATTDGVFRLPTGYVPSLLPGWQQTDFPLTHDTAKAAALYEQAGSPRLTLVTTDDALAEGVGGGASCGPRGSGHPADRRVGHLGRLHGHDHQPGRTRVLHVRLGRGLPLGRQLPPRPLLQPRFVVGRDVVLGSGGRPPARRRRGRPPTSSAIWS